MTFASMLAASELDNDSLLCVGLDPDPDRFPDPWRGDPRRIYDFCAAVVDATADLVIAYKPQIAHFAAHRAEDQLERLIAHIRHVAPRVPVILDAKRGDVGSTAALYAREAFDRYAADAVTLSPLLGLDSIEPYFDYPDKGLILLCRTSNPGGADLQDQRLAGGDTLWERVATLAAGAWNRTGQIGLVVGATRPDEIARARVLAPTLPILIPGVGAQGGDGAACVRAGYRYGGGRTTGPVIVSSSRAVLYAGGLDPAERAARTRAAATAVRAELNAARRGAVAGARAENPT